MELFKAITLSLSDVEEPIFPPYRIGLILHRLYAQKEYKGEQLTRLQKDFATSVEFNTQVAALLDTGVLRLLPGCSASVYSLLGRQNDNSEEIACSIDPFCYLSHLSAMAHHGITDRMPSSLFVSSPDPKTWKQFSIERMEKDLKQDFETYHQNGMPLLTRLKMDKIGRKDVHRFASSQLGAYKNVRGSNLRVSSLGRTFLEMLRNPELCGGMRHVIEVFENHGAEYLSLIVNEVDLHGTKVDKVRAGYILEERMKLKDARIDSWAAFAQRGGSRKLDASAEYMPKWSDKWCLSLNL
jgi:predicted transcriptional regulator of viral defense system